MISNYVKTAIRSLRKNLGFTFINIFGLTLGLATCLLIVFYVVDEVSYDRYNTQAERIYRVNNDIKFGGMENSFALTPAPTAAALKADFPEIEQVTRLRSLGGNEVRKGTQNIQEERMVYADSTLFDVFTLPMVDGDPLKALVAPHSIVITADMANKYFGRLQAVGETLILNDSIPFKVTGVIRDIPKQSHFHFDFFMSMATLDESRGDEWLSNNFNTYILLQPRADPKVLAAKFPGFMVHHAEGQLQSILHKDFKSLEKDGSYFRLSLTPLTRLHLESRSIDEFEPNGNIEYVYIFSATALFILLIACVNFMNLSTARSANRAREVGVRKVLGSSRMALTAQFLTESILVTFAAAVFAVLSAWAFLGLFNQLSGKDLTITPQVLGWLAPALLVIILVVGCLAGSYPALFLSAFQPIRVLKGKLAGGMKGGTLRNFLVVVQFSISIFLILGTLVIANQLSYISHKNVGYNRAHVLVINNVWELGNSASTFKQDVRQIAGVQDASLSDALPTDINGTSTTYFKDPVIDQKRSVHTYNWSVDEEFIPTLGMKIASGRNFSKDMLTDTAGVIINEAFARQLKYPDPIGQILYAPADNMFTKVDKYRIIGVVKDFNFKSLRETVTPILFNLNQGANYLNVRISVADVGPLLDQIKSRWKMFSANRDFSYTFLENNFDTVYRAEQRTGRISVAFTTLAMIIACLGLLGLAAYAAEQRTREIGIRKVLGANVSAIANMLAKDFIKLVILAIAIAIPLALWAMDHWLQGFAYRQNIQWWIPVLAGGSAIAIAFLTISFQSIKAALANPVSSLRSE
jgi:putative ABC transport system permease protein